MKITRLLIVSGMLSILMAGAASADVVFGNLGNQGVVNTGTNLAGSIASRWAVSFTTGSNPLSLELTEVVAGLSQDANAGGQNFSAILHSNNGGNPGTALATANATVPFSFTAGTKIPFEFPNVLLSATTQYWVTFGPTTGGGLNYWWTPATGSQTPVAHNGSGWSFQGTKLGSGSSWSFYGSTGGISIKAVPEPRTYAMLATGLVVVAGKTLRRRRTAQA